MNRAKAVALDPSRVLANLDGMEEDIAAVQIGLSQGIEFILLRWYKAGTIPVRVAGVDGVKIKMRYDSQANTDVEVVELRHGEDIVFMPDKRTRQRYAFLPHTEHNLNVLATGLKEARWEITDPEVLEVVKKLKEKKFAQETHDVSRMHTNMSDMSFQQPAGKYDQMRDEDIEADIERKRKELQELMRVKHEKENEATTEGVEFSAQAPEGMNLEEAKKLIHAKYKSEIDALKAEGKKFWLTRWYHQTCKPEVDMLVNPALREVTGGKEEFTPPAPPEPEQPEAVAEPEPEFEPPAQ